MRLNISKKTKIICTIGPASDNKEKVRELYEAGMNVMRINFSHGTHPQQQAKIDIARSFEEEGIYIPVALDTKGPEIRTGFMEGDALDIPDGHKMRISMENCLGNLERFSVTYPGLYDDVKVGDHVLIDDGNLDFEVIDKDEKYNPHSSHQDLALSCGDCHNAHEASVLVCNDCHALNAPEGWEG